MAYITVRSDEHNGTRTLHERLSSDDLDNAVFCEHLVERVRWAVEDSEPAGDLLQSAPPPVTLAAGLRAALDPRAAR